MKLLIGLLILVAAASAFGQDAQPAPVVPLAPLSPLPQVAPRLAILPALSSDFVVMGAKKMAPFTADESGETVRTLADGNRVVENWTGRMMRNSDGRIRREISSGQPGNGAARPMIIGMGNLAPDGIDPIVASRIDAEMAAQRATVIARAAVAPAAVYSTNGDGEASQRVIVTTRDGATAPEAVQRAVETGVVTAAGDRRSNDGKIQTHKESLGSRDFGGVEAEGTRVVTTYAAGALGNEREFESTSEVWYSKDLGVVVYSKHTDPRFGETTYQLTNVVRAEPDPSLFNPNK